MIRRLPDLKSFKQLAKSAGRDRTDTLLRGMSNGGYSVYRTARGCRDGAGTQKEKALVGSQWVVITQARFVKKPRIGPRSITQYH
jgi:hypothetical protein